MTGFGEAVFDVEVGAGGLEGMAAEEDLFGPHLFDLGGRPGLAGRIGEVGAVIGQHGVDRVGNGGGSARRKSPATRRVALSCRRRRRTWESGSYPAKENGNAA